MCDLCSRDQEELYRRRKHLIYVAGKLEELASDLRAMAAGRLKPHTEDARLVAIGARSVIRKLVADWL